MNTVGELFAQGFVGSIRLARDLATAPFIAWARVIKRFVTGSRGGQCGIPALPGGGHETTP
jgi:hypothetical protein